MMRICAMMIAAAFSVQPLPQADGPLEPAVQNEVDHAIALGERWLDCNFKDLKDYKDLKDHKDLKGSQDFKDFKDLKDLSGQLGLTNGQTRTEIALKLISTQKGGGWWLFETNAAPTRLAVKILKGL